MARSVSVVVGTFGSDDWIDLARERAWPSVLDQTFPAFELLHEHADTLASARNGGAAQSAGEWLCFLDADDELDPGYLEAMLAAPGGDLRQPSVAYIAPDGTEAPPELIPAKPLLEGNYLVIGTLVPRELFLRVGGFADWPIYEDWDLWIRCARAGAEIVQVPDAVYRAHTRLDSRNRPRRAIRRRYFDAIREQYAT